MAAGEGQPEQALTNAKIDVAAASAAALAALGKSRRHWRGRSGFVKNSTEAMGVLRSSEAGSARQALVALFRPAPGRDPLAPCPWRFEPPRFRPRRTMHTWGLHPHEFVIILAISHWICLVNLVNCASNLGSRLSTMANDFWTILAIFHSIYRVNLIDFVSNLRNCSRKTANGLVWSILPVLLRVVCEVMRLHVLS